jgi:60 kDa SS-A/Ro ribonucleoprotein
MRYLSTIGLKRTRQNQPILGANQVRNSAGGYVWPVDDWVRLDRFLILGSEGGSYYAREHALTRENAVAVLRAIQADGPRAVARIVEISESGRAPRNDPAIFALALAASLGDEATRRDAFAALPRVCRIGTHVLHFAQFVEGFRGWGRGLRNAVASWYAQPAAELALQAVKYQRRDAWSHRDLLRLAHPVAPTEQHQTLYHWITQGWDGVGDEPHPDPALRLVWALERAKRATTVDEIVRLIRDHRLPREAVPTEWLQEAAVWDALLDDMPMTALIRNLATMTRVGLLAHKADATARVVAQLGDGARIQRARVHPIAILAALKTYAQGHGERGTSTWEPVQRIVDALDTAFYTAFGNVEPTGKRWLLGLDVSGSMSMGQVAGIPGLTPRVAAAAMALVTAATEQEHTMLGFCDTLVRLSISPRQRLDSVVKATDGLPFGGTDCALPMLWATKQRAPVDTFVIYTDNETWFGKIHPAQALEEYRQRMGIPARLIVVGMVSNGFTIADPNDGGMLDVVGFDTATPQLIADFARE